MTGSGGDGPDDEYELVGAGSMSRVWIAGRTVRRERGAHSDTVAALLHHLEQQGFPLSPRHLGVDPQGRDVLTRLPGAPVRTLRGEEQLREVGALVRALHDALATFTPPVARWRDAVAVPGAEEIVVHGDIAPWNLLEDGAGRITGLVDFDSARPGRPVEDLAYTAWHVVPLHDEPIGDGSAGPPLRDRPRRFRVLVDAYGLGGDERQRLLGEAARMQVEHAARVARAARAGDRSSARHWDDGRFTASTARSLLRLDRHREALAQELVRADP